MISTELAAKSARLPIHIDVPEHFLMAKDQIIAVSSLLVCLEEINKRLFDGAIRCELIVLADEEGSHKTVTKIVVKGIRYASFTAITLGGISETIQFTETDTFKGAYHTITGKELDHYELSRNLTEILNNLMIGLYTTENEVLEKSIPKEVNLDKALKAKSDFYIMCLKNPRVAGVGFDDSNQFKIKRSTFPKHTSKDRTRPLPSDYKLFDTIIVSPVDIDKDSKWELMDIYSKNTIKANMRDDNFKAEFLEGKYPLKQSKSDDRLKVLIEYKREEKNGEINITETNIKTVYSFNDTVIEDPPSFITPSKHSLDERPMDRWWFHP